MSNIVCQKCRRLVRQSNIHYHEGDYFCAKCQMTYKLPDSYYKRGEFNIPILPKKSDLKVSKSEDELFIELPMNIFTMSFKISTVIIAFIGFIAISIFKGYDGETVYVVAFIFALIYLIMVLNAMAKRTIEVKGDTIRFCKNVFGLKFKDEQKIKKIQRVRQIEVLSNSENGESISHRFVEVYFNRETSWEFGHNLNKADREYIIAELKLFRLYNQVM